MESLRILFLFVIYIGLTAGQITLNPSTPTIDKASGEIVIVLCEYIGAGDVQPTWRDPNGNVIGTGGTDVSVTNPTSTITKLDISDFQQSHAGAYTCEASGGSKTITISYYQSPTFGDCPENQGFEIYTDARVKCEVTSIPKSLYEWKFKDNPLSSTSNKYDIEVEKYLQITNISREDDGRYDVQATVPTGNFDTKKRQITVVVLVPAKITLAPEDFNGTLGKTAEFKCIATGNPQPTYSWSVNNVPINDGGRYSIENSGEKLTITDLQKTDVGSYMCTASIEGLPESSNALKAAFLNVFIPPTVQKGIEVIALENEAKTLTCSTVSGDSSELIWRRFGEDMLLGPQPNAADIEVVKVQDGAALELRFSSVKRSYNGSYECFAKNSGGEDSSLSNLTVHFRPIPDTSRNEQEAYTSWIGQSVTLSCFWLSNPPARYYWQKVNTNTNLTEPKYVMSSTPDGESSLTFTPEFSTDFGVHKCIAYNTINGVMGDNEHIIDLKLASGPNAPTVSVLTAAPSSISLRIQDPEYTGGLDLIGYNISWTYELMGKDETTFEVFDYKDREDDDFQLYVIEGLLSSKEYKVNVAGVNAYAKGDPAPEIIERTLATREPYGPKITSDPESSKETEYTLTWEEPESSGAEISSYFIQYWEYDPDEPNKVIEDNYKSSIQPISKDYREFTITDLDKATYYRLQLWAENTIGEGDRTLFEFETAGERIKSSVESPESQTGSLETGTVIGIVIAAFLIVLIVVDISCCIVNDCGLTMCLCVHCCGRQAPGTKAHEIEMGEGDGNAAKSGKGAYTEIREDGDGSAPSEPPVEKDKLMGGTETAVE